MFTFENLSKTNTLVALIIAIAAVVLLLMSKKIAKKIMQNKHPDKSPEDKDYEDKLLSITLRFKGIAAALAVAACILSLL